MLRLAELEKTFGDAPTPPQLHLRNIELVSYYGVNEGELPVLTGSPNEHIPAWSDKQPDFQLHQ